MKMKLFYPYLSILLCVVVSLKCQNENCISEDELLDILYTYNYESFDSALINAKNNECTKVFNSIDIQQLSLILFDSLWNSKMIEFYDFKGGEVNGSSLGAFGYLTILNKYNDENVEEHIARRILFKDFRELEKLKVYGFDPNFLGKEGGNLIAHGVGNIYFLQGLNQLGFKFSNKIKIGKSFLDLSFDRIFNGFPIKVMGELQYFELDKEDLEKAVQVSNYIFELLEKKNFKETLKIEARKRGKVDFYLKFIDPLLSPADRSL